MADCQLNRILDTKTDEKFNESTAIEVKSYVGSASQFIKLMKKEEVQEQAPLVSSDEMSTLHRRTNERNHQNTNINMKYTALT